MCLLCKLPLLRFWSSLQSPRSWKQNKTTRKKTQKMYIAVPETFIKNSSFLVAALWPIQFDSEEIRCFDLLVNLCCFSDFLFIETLCIIDDDGAIYLQMSRTKCFIKACLRKWTGVTFQLCGSIEWVGISGHICEITPILTLSLCMLPSHLGVSTDTPGHRNTNTSQTAAFQLHRYTHNPKPHCLSHNTLLP